MTWVNVSFAILAIAYGGLWVLSDWLPSGFDTAMRWVTVSFAILSIAFVVYWNLRDWFPSGSRAAKAALASRGAESERWQARPTRQKAGLVALAIGLPAGWVLFEWWGRGGP